jgi:hypothetical protein
MVAGFIVLTTFVLGALSPRHAWKWALLVGPIVPIVHAKFSPLLTLVVILFGLAGAYSGAASSKVVGGIVVR